MNLHVLALIVSWLDARQRGREWQPPTSKAQMYETYRRTVWHVSPYRRMGC